MTEDVKELNLDIEVFDLAERAHELEDYLDSLTIPEEVDRDVVMGLLHEITQAYVALAAKLDLRAKSLIEW